MVLQVTEKAAKKSRGRRYVLSTIVFDRATTTLGLRVLGQDTMKWNTMKGSSWGFHT